MSKTIVLPSGARSREIQDASSVVKLSFRVVIRGSALVFAAALMALSFCAGVCARSEAPPRIAIARVGTSRRVDISFSIHGGVAGTGDWVECANDTRGREQAPELRAPPPDQVGRSGALDRRCLRAVQIARADRIAVSHPVVLSANSVQTKKNPPFLLITQAFEWRTIIAAPINPPKSMMT